MIPDPKISQDSPIRLGFDVFRKRCMPCHTMNGQGSSKIGPDLNLPMNPVEYFKPEALVSFIKNPESLRSWPTMGMKWEKGTEWSQKDIDHLVDYLKHKAANRP